MLTSDLRAVLHPNGASRWRWRRFRQNLSRSRLPRGLMPAVIGTTLISSSVILLSNLNAERFKNNILRQFYEEKVEQIARNLEAETLDWAVWDETYNHLLGRNPDYYKNQYNQYSFARTPFVMSLDRTGAAYSSTTWDFKNQNARPLPRSEAQAIEQQVPNANPMQAQTFLARFRGHPFLFSAQRVRRVDSRSPSPGRLLFARQLDTKTSSIKERDTLNRALGVTGEFYGLATNRSFNLLAPIRVTIPLQRWQGKAPMQLVIERQPRERLNALITMAIMGSGASILLTISLLRSYGQGRQVRLLEKRNQHARWQTSRDLEKRRNNDELTGLLSGAGLSKAMDIQTRRFPGFRQAIAHIDLDHFSLINNGLGKGQGDAVLQKFTRHLQAAMHPSAVIGRIGSDNFACCLISTSDSALRTEVSSLSQKLNDLIININNQTLNITVSIGAALVEECQHSQALHEAGIACSAVKVAGGHGYQFFGDAKGTTSGYLSIQQANQELVSAIHEERLELYGQHAWQLNGDPSLPATYVELLCRIKHPTSGAAYWREDIIEAAQLCGSLPLFDQTIIALACSSLKRLMQRSNVSAASTEPIYAINITPDTLITPHFAQKLDQLADSHGIDPQMICLEITEQAALRHPGEAIGAMRKLRQLGFRLALDDFGTGMTSLGYLRDLPLNYVKIDKSFIRKSAHDKPGNLIVQFVVELSKEIGFQTIAEGVEDLEQLLKLKAAGISIAQGYITTRPCPFLPSGDSWALTRSGAETLGEENLRSSSLSNPDQGTSQAQP